MMSVVTLGSVTLPGDMEWTDEFKWLPVGQQASYTITGALVLQANAVQAGRPITLEAKGDNHVWLPRSVIDDLASQLATPGVVLSLVMVDGRTFQVTGRHHDGAAVEADQVLFRATASTVVRDALPYTLILRLIQV